MPKQNLLNLTFASLAELDEGRLEKLLLRHLQNVSMDCINRPGDKASRKVTIELEFQPSVDPDTGDCEHVHTSVTVKSKVPTFRSRTYQMGVENRGFTFNRDFPQNYAATSLFADDEDTAAAE